MHNLSVVSSLVFDDMALLTKRYNSLTANPRCTLPLLVRMWLLAVVAMSFYTGPVLAQPANDNFPGQALPTTASGSLSPVGSNVGATAEQGEPDHIYPASTSVWYSWTAPTTDSQDNSYSTGTVTFSTQGSNFDTLLAVYAANGTPPTLDTLNEIRSNDDVNYPDDSTSSVNCEIEAGVTYYIAVDGYDGNIGTIQLQWELIGQTTQTLWAWGDNSSGQLGNGNINDSSVPLLVKDAAQYPIKDAIAVAAGGSYTLVLKSDGSVWAWGSNRFGQLGNNSTIESLAPVQVIDSNGNPFSDVKAIAAGSNHSLALKKNGDVWAWGYNGSGQLGNNSTTDSLVPVQVIDSNGDVLTDVKAIAAGGYHSLALKNDGTVRAWGENWNEQLGNNSLTTDSLVAIQVVSDDTALNNIKAIAAGAYHSLALKEDGSVWHWGYMQYGDDLGGNTPATSKPEPVVDGDNVALTNVKVIRAGGIHNLVLKEDTSVWTWHIDYWGHLSGSNTSSNIVPIPVMDVNGNTLTDVEDIAQGNGHSLAMKDDRTLWAWGNNNSGQLGNNVISSERSPIPAQVVGLGQVTFIAAGGSHSLALSTQGSTVPPVARDDVASTLKNTSVSISVLANDIDGDGDTLSITAFTQPLKGTAARNADGVSITYDPDSDYIGTDSFSYTITDAQGNNVTATVHISINDDGNTVAWGSNVYGQLGNGNTTNSMTPVSVLNMSEVKTISAGSGYSIALRNDGTVWAWGDNSHGELGDNSVYTFNSYSSIPVQVVNNGNVPLTNVKAIAAGRDISGVGGGHVLALKNDGTVWAWGSNWNGELGNNNVVGGSSRSAVQVLNSDGTALSDVKAITAGSDHSLALKNDGTVWIWGRDWNPANQNTNIEPVKVEDTSGNPIDNVQSIAGGYYALKNDGTVWAWNYGSGIFEQVMDSNNNALNNVQEVAASDNHVLVFKTDGTVWAWGYNADGQLGDGTTVSSSVPVQVQGLTDIIGVAAGGVYNGGISGYSLALKSNGTVWSWGDNQYGQLGDNTQTDRLLPVQVQNLGGVKAIAAGDFHSLATHGGWTGDDDAADGLPGSNGKWHVGGNWADESIPAADEVASIQKPGTYDVILDGNARAGHLTLGNDDPSTGNPSLDLSGNTLTLARKAQINRTGIVTGSGTIDGDVALDGVIHPSIQSGASGLAIRSVTPAGTGNINITRDVKTGALASIDIDIGGRLEGQHGVIGAADWQLDGTLNVELKNNFVPVVGEKIELLRWKTKSGAFRSVRLPQVANLKMETQEIANFNATYPDTTSLVLAVSAATPPQLAISNLNLVVPEGNSGTSTAKFNVTLSPVSTQEVKLSYATSNGTAKAPADYTATTGTLTIPAGQSSGIIDVPIVGDLLDEVDETFNLTLSNAVGATLPTNPVATGTITDDDALPIVSVANKSVSEGNGGTASPTNLNITITLSAASGKTVTVDYATSAGTALPAIDYTVTNGTASFTAGQTSKTITIPVVGDLLDEENETVLFTLSNPSNATLGVAQATGTINDDDALPSLGLSNIVKTEGNSGSTDATFTVTLSAISGRDVTVNYATADGTARQPGDYTSKSNSLTIPAGQGSGTINVPIVGDMLDEVDETFTLTLSGAVKATLPTNPTATCTITDDDGAPTLSIANTSVTEGNSGTVNAINADFVVSLSAASAFDVSVDYTTADGTAKAGVDYTTKSGTLTIPAGQRTRTISVPVIGDVLDEANESFKVNLSNAQSNGALLTITDAQATGTITDDDVVPSLTISNKSVTEGDSGSINATFTVTLSAVSGRSVTVSYATSDGTAKQPADYTLTSGTLTIAAGQPGKTISVPVLGDVLDEANESFTVSLSSPVNASIADAEGLGTITDNDATPSLSISNRTLNEGNGGTTSPTNASFTVTLSAVSGQNITVNYATSDGTAKQPADYTAKNGTLTFAAGQVSKSIVVPVIGDLVDEADESFVVNLSGSVNATIADNQGLGTIKDDDLPTPPTLSVNAVSVAEGAAGTTRSLSFSVRLSPVSTQSVSVNYATANGTALATTATASGDYTAKSGTLTFAAGESSKSVSVTINGDDIIEANETLLFNLSGAMGAVIGDVQGVGTILDDDRTPSVTIDDVSVTEGNVVGGVASTTNARFTLKLSSPSQKSVSVNAIPTNGTALSPGDYISGGANLTFAPGEVSKSFSVPVKGDNLDEATEAYYVLLSSAVNCGISKGRGVGTIVDNDAPPTISIDDVSVKEYNAGQTTAALRLKLSSPSGQVVRVSYATLAGTAIAGVDYVEVAPTQVAFTTGNPYAYVRVLINGDVLNEANETFKVNLSSALNATIADAQGLGTILNDDTAPALTINDVSISEGNSGTKNLNFTVQLSAASGRSVSVNYATADGIARSTSDYVAKSGTLSFAAGQTSKTINVIINGDKVVEDNEVFYMLLSGATNASISKARGTGTIINDDAS